MLETHNHADHVSGHGRLARATGATIHIHRLADAEYPHEAFDDGWVLRLGEVEIEAMHTAGPPARAHLLPAPRPRAGGEPVAVLTGDSLFVGDVARPDLAVEPEEGARDLYRSLHERLFTLPPAGRGLARAPGRLDVRQLRASTTGPPRRSASSSRTTTSPASPTADEFVADAVASLGDRPPNVEHVVGLNRGPLVEELGAPAPLTPRAVEVAIAEGALLVDARTNDQFDEAHIPGAISASAYDTGFATKVAQVVPPDVELIVVAASDGYELAAADLLASVGLRVRGFLVGGMTAWRSEGRPVSRLELIDPDELAARLEADDELVVLDVRDASEFAAGHIPGLVHIPYGELGERLGELPAEPPDRHRLQRRQALGPRRLDPPARGLRAGDPRRQGRRRHLEARRPSDRDRRGQSRAHRLTRPSAEGRSNDVWSSRSSVSGSPIVRSSFISAERPSSFSVATWLS